MELKSILAVVELVKAVVCLDSDGLSKLGSLLEMMAKRSPLGTQEKFVTVSACYRYRCMLDKMKGKRRDELCRKPSFRFSVVVDTHAEKIALILPI